MGDDLDFCEYTHFMETPSYGLGSVFDLGANEAGNKTEHKFPIGFAMGPRHETA